MSQFGYSHLQEEWEGHDSAPIQTSDSWVASFDDPRLHATALTDSSIVNQTPEAQSQNDTSSPRSTKSSKDTHAVDNVKYTPLSRTGVHELRPFDEESVEGLDKDRVVFDSFISINGGQNSKPVVRRFHVLICGLLSACAALVVFALIYVFVILPAHNGKIVYPDGQMHTADLAKLRKLGENVVVTSCGLVRGQMEGGAHSFKGIPYAEPPVGRGRWRPPVPLSYHSRTCWSGIFNATSFGSKCVQPKFKDVSEVEGDEDCLFLNIWTPTLNPEFHLPVIVWFHSGDFVYGSGNMPGMSPGPRVALDTNAVYVSFNYRLGSLGFLALDELRDEREKTTGNYGIMDQLLALRWVKENIGHFGGNENQITVFGHGSGATSIQALLASPFSTGLFHRAWLSSPEPVLNKTLSEACRDNAEFQKKSGCSGAQCMRQLTAKDVSRSSPWQLEAHWTLDQLIQPHSSQLRNGIVIFDGHIVHWNKAHEGPFGTDVPVVFGTSYFDLSSMQDQQSLINLTWEGFNDIIAHHMSGVLGTEATVQALKLYAHIPSVQYTSPAQFPGVPSAELARMIGDLKNVCPIKILADAYSYVHSSPAYVYVAELYPSHNMKLSSSISTTFVGWDVMAFFNGFDELGFQAGQGDINFQNVLREEVMSFARSGKPDASRWRVVSETTGVIGRGVTVTPVQSEYYSKCEFWKQYGFFKYTWL
ncbi:pyrethroid hydrolase Ces2a [Aplysia californica]|uniref:Pyrethroid hydrolase Ces2a n=1 Tax=Aplysia californica TaxID=6500 RepID=A0ABM0JRK6_APLCA|nr:pyrethroid hydrolase Ces2a [Aplysia californica]